MLDADKFTLELNLAGIETHVGGQQRRAQRPLELNLAGIETRDENVELVGQLALELNLAGIETSARLRCR